MPYAIFIALSVVSFAYRALVLKHVWTWFVVPLGAPAIGFWHAYGILGGVAVVLLGLYGPQDVKNAEDLDMSYFIKAVKTTTIAAAVAHGLFALTYYLALS